MHFYTGLFTSRGLQPELSGHTDLGSRLRRIKVDQCNSEEFMVNNKILKEAVKYQETIPLTYLAVKDPGLAFLS